MGYNIFHVTSVTYKNSRIDLFSNNFYINFVPNLRLGTKFGFKLTRIS